MSRFSAWLTEQVQEQGGFAVVQSRLPCDPRNLAQWMTGASRPTVEGQLALAKALECEFALIRGLLGLPCNDFAEWISRKIIAQGNLNDFCLKVEMSRSKLNTWLNKGTIPARWQKRDAVDEIKDALILWGDDTPPAQLRAEIEELIDRAHEAKFAGTKKSRKKVSQDCQLPKMA